MTASVPFRFEAVGSYLRPQALREARRAFEAGAIDRDQLTAVEDEAITQLVTRQKEAGLRAFTDGEFRRSTWHLDFMWGFEGVSHRPTETGLPFVGEAALIDDTFLTGRLGYPAKGHPFVQHFAFIRQFEDADHVAKLTIPAPAQFLKQFDLPPAWPQTSRFYASREELTEDVVRLYRRFIAEAYAAGLRNLQLDDCTWGAFVDPKATTLFGCSEDRLADELEFYLQANNHAIADHPDDLAITSHVCRGNYHSTYFSTGAYDRVSSHLFARENVSALYLEFDDERSGGFAPLRHVSDDKRVVLGLITTKSPKLESKEAIKARIAEAAQFVPLERLCLSPQCGFASCEVGNKLTEQEQWAKLALVRQIAEEVWGPQDA
ncbi:5-methyltetrahydropteroyltriglutamate--homocysteine S-methyltransferase [Eggerthellaceae bacterium zg-1084]|uniref:5-methyltetrahydropteroyltriglutamate-- homocysteine S-methyltransferase n=1 Tax=Berryella wangjianweii TaxID=2734634 RepID=UPI00155787A4|nr:5-methyltetrahydropteroyltriglutamate--homocysteine S-methyltransferase [Berryella wangjianweii]NPD31596.1 5-methyltetrahydropteroyltriglutamate--homocysteine S-methyltransferase [Berryella wangjianweii]